MGQKLLLTYILHTIFKTYLFYVCACVSSVNRGQRKVANPFELESQMVESHCVCVLEIKPRS